VFKIKHSSSLIQIEFPAEFKNVDIVLQIVQNFLKEHKKNIKLFNLTLALREALNNAIAHGARRNPELFIKCIVELKDNKVFFSVEDPGNGFDWEHLETDMRPSVNSEHGWGIFLLKQCCDGLRFYGSGNKVTFWFNVDNDS